MTKPTTHTHRYARHPRLEERAACTVCGFSIPLSLLKSAAVCGAHVERDLLPVLEQQRDAARKLAAEKLAARAARHAVEGCVKCDNEGPGHDGEHVLAGQE